MKPITEKFCLVLVAAAVGLMGCGKGHDDHDGHNHGEGAHGGHEGHEGHGGPEEEGGAEFAEGKGLVVHEEASEMIGLSSREVSEEKLALSFSVAAQVFQLKPARDGRIETALASAMISVKDAENLRPGKTVALAVPGGAIGRVGTLKQLDRSTARAIDRVEAIIEIPNEDDLLHFGSFVNVTFRGEDREVFAMPRSALLASATGNFVYVRNGERWLRTPVKIGASSVEMIEVVDGLYPGDVIASGGVVGLWLMELRFTKGGGHSH